MSPPNIKAVINGLADALPDAPLDIIKGARKIGEAKTAVTPVRSMGLLDKVDGTLKDLGSATGVGITALGAGVNKLTKPNKVGQTLKRIGVSKTLDPNKARNTGALVAGAATIPAFMGVNELSKRLDDEIDLEQAYNVDLKNFQ